MRRREFITLLGGGAVAWPLAARAQQDDRIRLIAVILGYAETDPETKSRIAAFRLGLEKRGWSEGRNIRFHYFFAPAEMPKQKGRKRNGGSSSRGDPRAWRHDRGCRPT
jgi:hypothetical protein